MALVLLVELRAPLPERPAPDGGGAGLRPVHRVTLQVVATGHGFDSDAARLQFYAQALESVRNVPGVTSAAFTSLLPLSGEIGRIRLRGAVAARHEARGRAAARPGTP